VLHKPKKHERHSSRSCQLGIDILVDSVDDALVGKVVSPHSSKAPKPAAVLAKLHQMFGQCNAGMQSMLRAALFSLKQAEGEKVGRFTQRADNLHDDLRRAGGKMSSATFLQCLKEGVLEKFNLTVRLFEMSASTSAASLAGLLEAEECRLARQESLRGQVAVSSAQNTAMVVTSSGGAQQWAPKVVPKGGGGTTGAATHTICWNCGAAGHEARRCTKPIIKPLRFKPADWKPRYKLHSKSAQPAVVA